MNKQSNKDFDKYHLMYIKGSNVAYWTADRKDIDRFSKLDDNRRCWLTNMTDENFSKMFPDYLLRPIVEYEGAMNNI